MKPTGETPFSRARLGILSDSHGRAATTGRAVRALLDRGAELLIHLGDLETIEVIDELAAAARDTRIVFGNCDYNEDELARYARIMDIRVDHPMGLINACGKTIAFTHGHIGRCMEEALAQGVDYLLHGHSHELRDEKVGGTRIINPGALFRARRYTAAVLDPIRDSLEIVDLS